MSKLVAIVGRPNVGKSTLFNRLIGERKAIVDDESGVTRDRIYGHCIWNGKKFGVVDTGGFVKSSTDVFESAIRAQVEIAIEEADIILFLGDVTTGITDWDETVAHMLRRVKKPVIVVVNKVDNAQRQYAANEFWSLGFEEVFFISSLSGSGTGELLDSITEKLPLEEEEESPDIPRFAIIGQPNVGKSTLTNALLGEERNIVTDQAGTTRDSIHSRFRKFDKDFILIDTAGIRKKAKVHEDLEFYSVMRAVRAIEEADVCFLLIDAAMGIEKQDLAILNILQRRNKGLVMLVNKWDLFDKETNTARDYEEEIKRKTAPFVDYPVLFISATDKVRIMQTLEKGLEVHENMKRRIKTSKLNEVMLKAIEQHKPPIHRGRAIKIKYVSQLPLRYPAFAFFCNHPKHVKQSYRHYLENQLRKNFDFSGVPVRVIFREK